MSDPMTPERIAKLRAAATFEHDRMPEERALIADDPMYSGLDFGDVGDDLMDALAEIERLRRVEVRLLRLVAIRDEMLDRIAQELRSVD